MDLNKIYLELIDSIIQGELQASCHVVTWLPLITVNMNVVFMSDLFAEQ